MLPQPLSALDALGVGSAAAAADADSHRDDVQPTCIPNPSTGLNPTPTDISLLNSNPRLATATQHITYLLTCFRTSFPSACVSVCAPQPARAVSIKAAATQDVEVANGVPQAANMMDFEELADIVRWVGAAVLLR